MKAKLKHFLKKCMLIGYRLMTVMLPVDPKLCVFMSNLGRSYGGSPKSIYEKMLANGLTDSYRCCFILDDPAVFVPGNAVRVRNSRFRYYYVMARAGVLISDTRFPNYIVKRKQTSYLQTWHGTPLKKLALDMTSCHMAGNESIESYQSEFKKNSATWDYLIAQNEFSENIFRRCFAFDKQMLRIGYPRNDVLFEKNDAASIAALRETYGITADKKVILYAPTWRDNSYYDNASYKMDAPIDYDALYEELHDEYVILIKYHYMVRERLDFSRFHGFYQVIDGSSDIADLYLMADLLITDYSSVMFDYSLLKRPMIFFVYDLEEYKEELRGFYFDFAKEAPGPLCMTTKELITAVKTYDSKVYQTKYEQFHQKYHTYEHGDASLQVIKTLFDR